MSWTDERIEQLKALWDQGLSASQIARALGNGISRNAVIGKVHRLGMAGRAVPQRPRGPATFKPPKFAAVAEAPEPVREPEAITLEDGTRLTALTIKDRLCRWPFGDPANPDFHFCGNETRLGFVYCDPHTRKAYQPGQTRKRDGHADELAQIARNARALEKGII